MAYFLTASYAGESLLSSFNWFEGVDPSHGFVSYQSRQDALDMGLYDVDEGSGVVRLGVDSTLRYSPLDEGRPSIRIESKETYDHGLFIADFLHMPPSQCGLWPAFWTYGDNWPYDGEIDIIEGVNTAYTNIISAHTADGCSQSTSIDTLYRGVQLNTECAVGTDNIGCGFNPSPEDTSSYGDGFNAAYGGVYAMEWDPAHIRIWNFPRGAIPEDIENKEPSPDEWGQPVAIFGGPSCDVNRYFKNMRLVLNINFCGDYGNAVWGKSDTCNDYAPTCAEYVADNPEAFANAYWDVRYIDAYEFRPRSRKPRPSRPGRPDRPDAEDEPTTTTTMRTQSTETVTVLATGYHHPHGPFGPHGDDAPLTAAAPIEPVATTAPVHPTSVNEYSYLGCFHSSSGFRSFHEVADGEDMNLERCVELCDDEAYAGVFGTHCFCAQRIDARTRATSKEGLCNRVCPGDGREFCGGIVGPREDDGPREEHEAASSRFALTVYGRVAEERPEAPPAMAPGSNEAAPKPYRPQEGYSGTVTAVAEVTVFPVSEHDWHFGHEGDGGKGDWREDGGQKGDEREGDEREGDEHEGNWKDSAFAIHGEEDDLEDCDEEDQGGRARPMKL
ncbi:glycoside hydrolase family 16 protein [Trichoderma cornu-damae]|uniref:Glycoside hydrolase family 16 protein n=1 Tax=Trichoderma cornu-damae TaxID=654480 RepID=A0A9P8QJM6_9HYPO|nr:glycoside hydrolase family 16 protein [Trichoderma cornu-damae]